MLTGRRNSESIPEPLIYKLPDQSNFSVPPYFQTEHRETRKMINFMKGGYWHEVRRVIEKHPIYATNGYYQIEDNALSKPLFHNFTVVYLSIFGMALYYKKINIARQLARITRANGERFIPWNTLFYATNIHDRYYKFSDLYGFYAFSIIIRLEFFEALPLLMEMGYQPHAEISLPYRRPYSYYVYHYRDIIDYSLAQLFDRPNLFLAGLAKSLISSGSKEFNMCSYEKIVVIYNDNEVTDWISIPRRFLRYIFYVDRNNIKVSNCLQAVKIFQESGFFDNSSIACSVNDIHLANRLDYPSLDNAGGISLELQVKRIVFDHDCSIALLLAIYESLVQDNSLRIAEKAASLLIQILNDTRWLLLFLTLPPILLSEYFNSLTENVTILARYIAHFIETIPHALDTGLFTRRHALLELRKSVNGKNVDWRTALNAFKDKHKTGLGGLASYTPLYDQHNSSSNVTPNMKDESVTGSVDKDKTFNSSSKEMVDSVFISKKDASQKLGSRTDLSQKLGSRTDTSQKLGSRTDPSQKLGSKSDPSQKLGSRTDLSQKLGSRTDQSQNLGSRTDQSQKLGSKSDPSQKPGSKSDPSQKPGSKSDPSQKPGSKSDPSQKPGSKSDPSQKIGSRISDQPSSKINIQKDSASSNKKTLSGIKTLPDSAPNNSISKDDTELRNQPNSKSQSSSLEEIEKKESLKKKSSSIEKSKSSLASLKQSLKSEESKNNNESPKKKSFSLEKSKSSMGSLKQTLNSSNKLDAPKSFEGLGKKESLNNRSLSLEKSKSSRESFKQSINSIKNVTSSKSKLSTSSGNIIDKFSDSSSSSISD